MSRSVSRKLYLAGLVLFACGFTLAFFAGIQSINGQPARAGISMWMPFFIVPGIALVISAWIGALIRMARLERWGWFTALLLLNVTMCIYIFEGPDEAP